MRGDKTLRDNEPQSKVRGRFPTSTTIPARTVNSVDYVGSLQVVATPGHTSGHISLQSARTLRALEPERLAPGHGEVIAQPAQTMQRAIDAAARRQ